MNNNSELNVFRLLRIARNKKVKEIAEELSITPAYVHAIESGKNFPSGRLLKDYAKVLGVDEKTIVNFKPDKKNNLVFENSLLRLLQIICKIGNSQEWKIIKYILAALRKRVMNCPIINMSK